MALLDATIAVLEAAYRRHADERAWLEGLIEPLERLGLGPALGYFVDAETGIGHSVGIDRTLIDAFVFLDPTLRRYTHTPAPRVESSFARLLRLERISGLEPGELAPKVGIETPAMMGILGTNADGNGSFVGIYDLLEPGPLVARHLAAIGAHLEVALRLHRSLPEVTPEAAAAVFAADGRQLHTTGKASEARSSLARAVRNLDAARGPLRKREPERAPDLWSALVEGRWTLIEHVESDGKRLILAMENPAEASVLGLSGREGQVATYAALGHSQKYIAYELGLHPSYVSRYLRSALVKLRLESQSELIRVFGPLARLQSAAPVR